MAALPVSLAGRVAIVSGAGRGLGRAHALALARLGANVVVNDIGGEGEMAPDAPGVVAEIEAEGGEALLSTVSVATPEGGRALVEATLARFGTVDVVVNNAGFLLNANFEDLTPAKIDDVLEIHLKAAFWVTQPAFEVMRDKGHGRIVCTSSSSGMFGMGGLANYAAAKAGLYGLVRALAVEGAEFGITANAILPYGNAPWRGPGAHASRGKAAFDVHHILGPRLDPSGVAPLVSYLCSDACAVTGEVYSAIAGRYARVFVGLTPGWLADDPYAVTADDIAGHLDEIRATDGFWIPASIGEEMREAADRISG
ncbi:MAG: SDR family oxidoreductase [Actinobacteria bacterium]|nr:SDR family oxidoreductase [Actinomycetota bacterium]